MRPVVTRILLSVLALWIISIAFFATIDVLPGDFASVNATRDTTLEELDQARVERGLYLPVQTRYWLWLKEISTGNWGYSWGYGRAIGPILSYRLGNTFYLALMVAAVALPIAFVLGIYSAIRLNQRTDRSITTVSLVGISIPEFVLAYTFMYLFAVKIPLLPAFTPFYPGLPTNEYLLGMVMPVAALSITTVAPILRLTRASILNVLSSSYIEMAHQKGMSTPRVILGHALPNALGPIAQAMTLTFSNLLLGVVVIEYVFAYPGIGRLMVDAVLLRDVPMMMACTMVFALIYMLLNVAADVVSILSNPRLRYPLSARHGQFGWSAMTPKRFAKFSGAAAAVALIAVIIAQRDPIVERKPVQAVSEVKWSRHFPPPGDVRDKLTVDELLSLDDGTVAPIHFGYFKSVGTTAPAHELLNGEIRIPQFSVTRGV
ncbi:MAG: ABC transporter permease, partial [Pseudomonadota bacterium]